MVFRYLYNRSLVENNAAGLGVRVEGLGFSGADSLPLFVNQLNSLNSAIYLT